MYQVTGFQYLFRALHLNRLLPRDFRELEPITPTVRARFSHQLIASTEKPPTGTKRRVALLTGCVQDLVLPEINRDTADVLLANDCEVFTPPVQPCCGSLHGHNGELELARTLARQQIDLIDPFSVDAIISNAGGCGSHLRHYDRLLEDDPVYRKPAAEWSKKLKDIHEYLVEIGFRPPLASPLSGPVTYHESCHLSHGQHIISQPRAILKSIPGLQLVELPESQWCCGSAGIYNITQPEMAAKLQTRKMKHIKHTGAPIAATANPGCHLQLETGAKISGMHLRVAHPISLLAEAYRAEKNPPIP
jgi:glycolate oxidase iron-sulfur subunit